MALLAIVLLALAVPAHAAPPAAQRLGHDGGEARQIRKGAMTFLRYLTTLLQHQELQRNVLRSELAMLEYRISLYRALSGGWEMVEAPTAKTNPTTPQPK